MKTYAVGITSGSIVTPYNIALFNAKTKAEARKQANLYRRQWDILDEKILGIELFDYVDDEDAIKREKIRVTRIMNQKK